MIVGIGHKPPILTLTPIVSILHLHMLVHPPLIIVGTVIPSAGPPSIISLPLAFVRSGWVDIANSAARVVGQYGYRWSRVSKSTTNAYVLAISPTDAFPSSNDIRRDGFPLRCLYLGSFPTSNTT